MSSIINGGTMRHAAKAMQSDLEINFLGAPARGKSMRVDVSLLNTPGLDMNGDIRSPWDRAAVKRSVCLPCRGVLHSEEGVDVRAISLVIYAEVLRRFANANAIKFDVRPFAKEDQTCS